MRIIHALLALATLTLSFSYALTLNLGFPLKIYEVCLVLAAPLFFLLGQWKFCLKHWRFLLLFMVFLVAILFTLFYRFDHPGLGFAPETSENRFSPFVDSALKIGYAALNFVGFFMFAWFANQFPGDFLKFWTTGAVISAGYSIYAALFSAWHLPVLMLPGVEVVQYYDDYIVRNGTFLEGNYSGLFYLISGILAVREKRWGAFLVLSLGVLSSLSTTSILMLGVTVVLLIGHELRHIRIVAVCAIFINVLLILGIVGAAVAQTKFGQGMIHKVTDSKQGLAAQDISFSRDNRLDTAETALRMFASQPLTGVGIAQYTNYYLNNTKFPIQEWSPQQVIANNVYAEILGETGLVGSIPFFTAIVLIVLLIRKSRDFYFLLAMGEILFGWNAFPTFSIMYVWAFFGGAVGYLEGTAARNPPVVPKEALPVVSPGAEVRPALAQRSMGAGRFVRNRFRRGRPWQVWSWMAGARGWLIGVGLAGLIGGVAYYAYSQREESPLRVPQGFILGVNGHAPEQEIYDRIPPETQMELLQELGVHWYRVAWSDSSTPEQIDRLLAAAAAAQVHILPVLTPRIDLTQDRPLADYAQEAETFARKWVGRYAGQLETWELGNELEVEAILKRGDLDPATGKIWDYDSPDGSEEVHYDPQRLARVLAVLQGLSRGVAAVQPNGVRLIGTAGWKHYGFLKAVEREGIAYEKIAWHWYSEMGLMTNAGGTNVLDELRQFHRDIWITEAGRRNGSIFHSESDQASYYQKDFYRMVGYYPQVKAYFAYELLDEPAMGLTDGEAYYGLVQVEMDAAGRWLPHPKPAFQVIQSESEWLGRGSR